MSENEGILRKTGRVGGGSPSVDGEQSGLPISSSQMAIPPLDSGRNALR
jgi:hypothetical protein